MTRRSFLAIPAAIVAAVSGQAQTIDPCVDFARSYNDWITKRTALAPGSFDVKELRLWEITKNKWNRMRKIIDADR